MLIRNLPVLQGKLWHRLSAARGIEQAHPKGSPRREARDHADEMMSDARQNRPLALGIIIATPLLIGFLTAVVNSKPGEIAGALGSVLGGVIGAGGAALAVALTLLGERAEEK